MAQLLGIHIYQLKPSVAGEEFEHFLRTEWKPWPVPGVKTYFAKAVRHDFAGSYSFTWEFETLETYKYYFPVPGRTSPEWKETWDTLNTPEHARLHEKLLTFVTETGAAQDWEVIAT